MKIHKHKAIHFKNSFAAMGCLYLCLLLLNSCGGSLKTAGSKPSNILSEEQLTQLLVDFSLAESAANMNISNLALSKVDSVYSFYPLTDNKVRSSQYDSTIAYYIQHPEEYKKIYESVLETLTELQAKRKAEPRDSVSK